VTLTEFSKQIEDPEVRQGIVAVGIMFNDTRNSLLKFVVKLIFYASLAVGIVVALFKYGDKVPGVGK
jgi:sensor histidine kinase regulating citrate/malate metabolism